MSVTKLIFVVEYLLFDKVQGEVYIITRMRSNPR